MQRINDGYDINVMIGFSDTNVECSKSKGNLWLEPNIMFSNKPFRTISMCSSKSGCWVDLPNMSIWGVESYTQHRTYSQKQNIMPLCCHRGCSIGPALITAGASTSGPQMVEHMRWLTKWLATLTIACTYSQNK